MNRAESERDLNWKHRINKGERNRFWPGDGGRRREREGVRGRMTVQRRRRERERGRARCNLSQGPSAFLFYQQPIGPHTKRPLGFHSDGGHFAPRHPINSSRAVCNTVVMCCDTIYPPRAQREACAILRSPVQQRFENRMIASSGENYCLRSE